MRMSFKNTNNLKDTNNPEFMVPLKVSRATNRMSDVKKFYD